MNDMSMIPDGVVHVKGNRIVEVGARDKIAVPASAKVIDVTGKTLMPGLIDIHAHPGSQQSVDLFAADLVDFWRIWLSGSQPCTTRATTRR